MEMVETRREWGFFRRRSPSFLFAIAVLLLCQSPSPSVALKCVQCPDARDDVLCDRRAPKDCPKAEHKLCTFMVHVVTGAEVMECMTEAEFKAPHPRHRNAVKCEFDGCNGGYEDPTGEKTRKPGAPPLKCVICSDVFAESCNKTDRKDCPSDKYAYCYKRTHKETGCQSFGCITFKEKNETKKDYSHQQVCIKDGCNGLYAAEAKAKNYSCPAPKSSSPLTSSPSAPVVLALLAALSLAAVYPS